MDFVSVKNRLILYYPTWVFHRINSYVPKLNTTTPWKKLFGYFHFDFVCLALIHLRIFNAIFSIVNCGK